MSEYLKLPPSGMATASENDTFLTQLMNDNMRKAGQQLPCCGRMPMVGVLQVGYPARLAAVNPPTAGKEGAFLGIVLHADYKLSEAVVQFAGVAEVVVRGGASVGDFLCIDSHGAAVRTTLSGVGSNNFIGNVVDVVSNRGGVSLVRVLLRSWCGESGRAWTHRPFKMQIAAGLCAEHRPSGGAGLVAGVVSVAGSTASGFALINRTGTVMRDNSVHFTFTQRVANCVVSPADHSCTAMVNHDNTAIVVARYNKAPIVTAQFNILCSVEAQNG